MSEAQHDRRIDYIEFPCTDLAAAKQFYTEVFGWRFTDYGPDYTSFEDGRLSGGFTKADRVGSGPLVPFQLVSANQVRQSAPYLRLVQRS